MEMGKTSRSTEFERRIVSMCTEIIMNFRSTVNGGNNIMRKYYTDAKEAAAIVKQLNRWSHTDNFCYTASLVPIMNSYQVDIVKE